MGTDNLLKSPSEPGAATMPEAGGAPAGVDRFMPMETHYLGWNGPALRAAALKLLERAGEDGDLDLQQVTIALPVGRAGRRLLELLVRHCEERSLRLTPPRMVTAGQLPDLLCPTTGKAAAGAMECRLAWMAAMNSGLPQTLKSLLPHQPDEGDVAGWAALADQLAALRSELAGAGLDFSDVVEKVRTWPDVPDESRWVALAEIEAAYLKLLDQHGMEDEHERRRAALAGGRCGHQGELILLGLTDLNAAARAMVRQASDNGARIQLFIHAPEERAADFDELGGLNIDRWAMRLPEIPDDWITVADRPTEQAESLAAALRGLDGGYSCDQITVGLCDPRILPHLQQRLEQESIPSRYAGGKPLGRTGPWLLMEAAADFISSERFSDFAALLRHPDLHARLMEDSEDGAETEVAMGDWLSLLDEYHNDHLQMKLSGYWLGEAATRRRMKALHDKVLELVGELKSDKRPMHEWAEPIAAFLVAVYGGDDLDRTKEADAELVGVFELIRTGLMEMHEACPELSPEMEGAEAMRLLLGDLKSQAARPEVRQAAIEILGWLELAMDDAPALMITGFNENCVPATLNAHAFLPDQFRGRLGLTDNHHRLARDSYALTTILSTRPVVRIIAGMRSAEGDPMLPSRLIMGHDDLTILRRVEQFHGAGRAALPRRSMLAPGMLSRFNSPPKPQPVAKLPQGMKITAFRDYLNCPYRFYLKHILRLSSSDDQTMEMDAMGAGSLIHAVLADFGRSELRQSTRAEQIAEFLLERLDERFKGQYGQRPPVALRLQKMLMEGRLGAAARWQAHWSAEGWRIQDVEVDITGRQAALEVDGERFALSGRIDRIDRNSKSGELAVIDFKTGAKGKRPESAHQSGGEWIDLQLPLYHFALASTGEKGRIQLGYVVLPENEDATDFLPAGWSEGDLAGAVEKAQAIVRDIRAQRFWPPNRQIMEDEFQLLMGMDDLAKLAGSDTEEEEQP